jgi:AraC-like DNA-binding protein
MILKEFTPSVVLRELVQRFRIMHFEFETLQDVAFKHYAPRPECILHFTLRDFWAIGESGKKQVQPSVVLRGQRISAVQQFTGQSFLAAQIVFQPAAIFRLSRIPASELSGQHIDAQCIFSNEVFGCLEQLQNAADYAAMVSILECFVLKIAANVPGFGSAIDSVSKQMIRGQNMMAIDSLADDACMSVKHFRRRFYEQVGVNPLTYARIIRLNRACNLKNAHPDLDWLSIAIDCDYFDYQHMAKDFKQFTGQTPIGFQELEHHLPERVLGLTNQLYLERIR